MQRARPQVSSALLAAPHLIADRFEVLGLAGAGGSASVYRALDRQAKAIVAVKVLRANPQPEDMERFTREAALLAGLSHPNIVRYVAHGREQGELYLAMEWLEGVSLAERLAKKPLTIEESVSVAHGVADALAVAHARGVVHRDVKPGNIFLVGDDPAKPKLLDFGIARIEAASELTQTGMLIGTPGYLSPEQARGAELDARADVFSLGCVLFRCLTGKGPFAGSDIVAVLTKVLLEEAPLVRQLRPEIPAAVEQLVAAMLSKQPSDRPADGARVGAAIAALGAPAANPAQSRPTEALGRGERRMMCILLSRATTGSAPVFALGDTIRGAVAAQGGQVEVLADRSLLVTLEATGTPTDSAARAARCALAIRSSMRSLPIVLVAGEGERKGGLAVGPVIDRGAALLQTTPEGSPVQIDQVIAGFLDARFDVRQTGTAITLVGERSVPSMTRSFLGRPSACVGRERDLAMLDGVWAETVDDSVARIVLVTGAAGIGKSRLLDEFLRRVGEAESAPAVWTARGDPMSARARFSMIADPIRQAAGIRVGEPLDDHHRKLQRLVHAAVAKDAAPRVSQFLGEIAGLPSLGEASVELQAARRDAQLMADQTRRAWEDWLDGETRRRPVVLVLEDLQWGDVASVQFVDAAARHLAKRPFMVLALARPEVYEQFPAIWNERNLTEMRLRGLTEKAAMRLVRDALGASADDAVVERIVERGQGNAFFLEELLRAEIDGKGAELPTTVVGMVQARLAALGDETRRLLRAASIFGRIFSLEGVTALLGPEERAEARNRLLAELIDKDVVQRSGSEAGWSGELAFRHAIVHEAAYAMLTDADRSVGHRLAGEYLAALGHSDPAVLAEHFERGAEIGRASSWYLRAAEQALRSHDQAGAIRYVEHTIRCGVSEADEGALRLVESEARRWRGENQLARAAAVAAMGILPTGSTQWCDAASQLATVSGSLGDTERLVELAGQLLALPVESATSASMDALARVARPLFWAGKLSLASEALARAMSIAERAHGGQPTADAALHMARGVEARLLGDPSACVACNELAVAASERAGDLRGACVARGNLGYAFLEIGAFEDAERALTEALVTARRLDVPLVVATAQQNLGIALARRGDYEQAARLEHASLITFESQGDGRRAGCSLLYLALVRIAEGRFEEAMPAADRAAELCALNPPLRCHILAVQAEIAFGLGDTASAVVRASDAWRIFGELGTVDEGESRIRLIHAEALFAAGEGAAGLAALADARTRLLARAARIEDPNRRRAFLEAIPENARTLAHAEGR